MASKFNEDTRVKIPTILHLVRLGYQYLSLKGQQERDPASNIFTDIFYDAIARINSGVAIDELERLFQEIRLLLDYEDLGKAFYERLLDQSGIRLIDFENVERNQYHVVTELPYQNGDDVFRPDITLLINGMPLVFIEVKKPNNHDGVLAERFRMDKRCRNRKYRRFMNITQFMIFSNNMPYDDKDLDPIQGAFYASSSYDRFNFNHFREEEALNIAALLKPEQEDDVRRVLKDTNYEVIRHNPEFLANQDPNRPTNRICTSLLSKERLAFILRYGLAYVVDEGSIQKHIMRYPQLFATKAIEQSLEEGGKGGIIWHTQGSGKTALAYYSVPYLSDYFKKRHTIAKFYFIVDRLDLLQQAQREFIARGLLVHTIDSRDAFAQDIKSPQAIHNDDGKPEITVVNIQKFKDDADITAAHDYDINIQRIYFIDEAHRSYNPKGSFLANLKTSDRNAIMIGLTGTPLIGENLKSRDLFGDYIHRYYYNASIADGYTLRLMREEIATQYRLQLQQALAEAEIKAGSLSRKEIYAHRAFVRPMLDFIVDDFTASRGAFNDDSIGAMVVCDSAEQARALFDYFEVQYGTAIQPQTAITGDKLSAALILHDHGSKEERKNWVFDFKAGGIDFLFVYNMLLTGFDAPRLKKLYLGRLVKAHNLLQALTRVNRTYKQFRYGYVVDFADIRKEFDATNKAYFDELQTELGDEMAHYDKLFKTPEEIAQDIDAIKEALFHYDTGNAELFSDQISAISERKPLLELKNALNDARSLYHLIRLQGEHQFLADLDFIKLNRLYRMVCDRLSTLNLKAQMAEGQDIANLLNQALEDTLFQFQKVGEEELILADELKNTLRQTREALADNIDHHDPEYISLREELERLFKNNHLDEVSQEAMTANLKALNAIHERIKILNRQNMQLSSKYHGDHKYTRIHKRLRERGGLSPPEQKIFAALSGIKQETDERVLNNEQILNNENYFTRHTMPVVVRHFEDGAGIDLNAETSDYINGLLSREYLNAYRTGA